MPWLRLLLLTAGLAVLARPGLAQPTSEGSVPWDKSKLAHTPLGVPEGAFRNPDERLNDRLGLAQRHLQASKLAQQILKNDELRESILDKLRKEGLLRRPGGELGLQADQLREAIRPLIESGELPATEEGKTLGPEQFEAITERLRDSMKPETAEGTGSTLPGLQGGPQGMPSVGAGVPDAGPSPGPEPRSPEPDSRTGELARGFLEKLADRLEDVDPALAESPALQRALRDLNFGRGPEGESRWPQLEEATQRVGSRLADWGRDVDWQRLRPNINWDPGRLRPPGLRAPSWGRRWLPRLPSLGTPAPRSFRPPQASPSAAGGIVLWLLALAVVGWALWKFGSLQQAARLRGTRSRWRLGPWPVDPKRVSTREDLVRAFEYLSLLCLGAAARHWNHREIAAGMGGDAELDDPRRRQAAERLAGLYERARYAPPAEGLPEEELADARHDLCLLARVPSA